MKITSKIPFTFTVTPTVASDSCAVVLVKMDKYKNATKVQVIDIPKNSNGDFTTNVSIDVNDPKQDYTNYYVIINNLNTKFNLNQLVYTFSMSKGVLGVDETTANGNNFAMNAYPNPCNGSTNLDINLNEPQSLSIYIYDINGKKIKKVMYIRNFYFEG